MLFMVVGMCNIDCFAQLFHMPTTMNSVLCNDA